MRQFTKKLAIVGTAAGLMTALGVAWAQVATYADPNAAPDQNVTVTNDHKPHIMYFADQGNSPETDPAAHLLLIKDAQPQPVAMEETTTTSTSTTVADATPPADTSSQSTTSTDTGAAAAPADTTSTAPAEDTSAPPPKADRN
jgi:cytoskeletal protein RodZ